MKTDEGKGDVRLTDEQRLDWLRLIRSENIGPRTFRTLINHYGGAKAALAALPELARRGGAARAGRICSQDEAEREFRAAARIAVRFVALGEIDYPARLAATDDAPPLLAVRGSSACLARPMRLAQRVGRGHEIRRVLGARTRVGRLGHRLGPRARHRCRGP